MNRSVLRIMSRAIFFLGASLGLALAVLIIWNQMEAIHYYFNGAKYEPFNGLRCPLMIAPTEKGIATAAFNNPTNRDIKFFYRVEISGTVSARQIEDQIAVAPHQTKSVQLSVDINDVDLGFFIFVKVNILPNSLHRAEQAVCGIMVTNILALAGNHIPPAALSLSFLGMAIGLALGQQTSTKEDRNTARVTQALGILVLLTLLAAALGWWLAGIALSAVTLLLLLISARFAFP